MPQPCDHLLTNIGCLVTLEGEGPLTGAALGNWQAKRGMAVAVSAGRVLATGPQSDLEATYAPLYLHDLEGQMLTPGLVDCHTHPVWVKTRAHEFEMRLAGATYESIMEQGGGIANSVLALRAASDDDLMLRTKRNLRWLRQHGVVCVEGKSGYGLSLTDELRSLRLLRELQGYEGLHISPTCLAAHVVPPEYRGRKDEYLKLVVDDLLPAVAEQGLADAVDIFVEEGAFNGADARVLLAKARELGLAAHVHADQLRSGEGTKVAIACRALSADHLEYLDEHTLHELAASNTAAVLLPGSTFALNQNQWADGRALIDAGAVVALATDFNPGSSPICNPAFIMSLACLKCGLRPYETLAAFTRNAAHVLRLGHDFGSIERGRRAAFAIWDLEDPREIPYYAGANLVRETLILE